MRKLIVLALMLAGAAFAREASLYVGTGAEAPDIYDGSPGDVYFGAAEFEVDGVTRCDGAVTLGDDPADVITVTGTMALTSPVSFPAGTVLLPGIHFTGDPNTGLYWIGADNFGFSAAGALVGDFDATGLNNCPLGQTTPLAADVTTLTTTGITDLFAGAVGAPSVTFTGSATSGFYEIGADNIGIAIGGALLGDFDATGLNNCPIGQTTPLAADVTTLTTTGITDLFVGAVGAPSVYYTGSATTGYYQTAADELGVTVLGVNAGTWDGTGLAAVGFNGPIGTTVPAQGEFTNIYGDGDFYYGQTPADLHEGYKERSDYITFSETFDTGVDADLAVRWDIATLVVGGASTVDETTNDGWCTLTTGGAGGPDSAGIRSAGLNHYPAYAPKIETVVDLGAIAAGQTFHFGFWAAANRFAEIIHEPATSANWLLRVDDTLGAETIDSTVAATVNPTKLEIAVTAGGVITWAIDDVAMTVVGLTNLMANPHYVRWYLLDVAAAGHTATIDYYQSEQLKQQ